MNEKVLDLVDAIAQGDALQTEKAFQAAMAEKLSVKLDDMRAQVAQNMFASEQDENEPVVEEEIELEESHFKLGDTVKCKDSGMTGKVTELDKEHGEDDEKYYTVKRSDGKTVKYAPNELTLVKEELDESEEFHFTIEEWEALSEEEKAEYEIVDEAMNLKQAQKSLKQSYGAAHDTHGQFDTERKTQAAAKRDYVKAKKVIKTKGGDYKKTKSQAVKKFERDNMY